MTGQFEIVAGVAVGADAAMLVIAGPCVIEGREHALRHAEALRDLCSARGLGFVYKSSFDKANRTSIAGHRGVGIDDGLRILAEVRSQIGVPVVTDIHEPAHAEPAGEVCDVLQIPAFLCRQTDLLLAAGATQRVVNVKKGQFLSPAEMEHSAAKVVSGGSDRVLLTERGTTFGYNDLVVDMRSLPKLRSFGFPVLFDATHSVQQPGGRGGSSGGRRDLVPYLARAAAAVGVDGFFMEVHEDPDRAPSDGPNMVDLQDAGRLLDDLVAIREAAPPLPPVG